MISRTEGKLTISSDLDSFPEGLGPSMREDVRTETSWLFLEFRIQLIVYHILHMS
jgi:hypothetical protein